MKQKLTIHYETRPIYDIVFSDSFTQLGECLDRLDLNDRKICIVSDSTVAHYYLDEVLDIVKQHCAMAHSFVFPAGEENKNLDTVQNLIEALISYKFERKDYLIALGGGVTGDLTGFAASIYLRGIEFIQIPTSLLAQVDSSIGGKTGVDFRAFKNMVGAFHQPKLVYTNFATLKTLTQAQYVSGLGEILKHGLIKDSKYFDWLIQNRKEILDRNLAVIGDMIIRSDEIKAAVVENDPKEKGERALLNFGHTLGHSVEKLMNFSMLHGECVAVGMHAAAWISMQKGYLSKEQFDYIIRTLIDFELPIRISGISAQEIVEVSKSDKKMDHGKVKFILLDPVGHGVIDHTIDDDTLFKACEVIIKS